MGTDRNYARFYTLLKKMPCADKETLVYQFTQGRTAHLRQMTAREYEAMCRQMEDVTGYDERRRKQYELLRKARSGVLHQLQIYGIDTTDWNRVDAFCKDPRIAGKRFKELDADELNGLNTKMRMIIRKKSLTPAPSPSGEGSDYRRELERSRRELENKSTKT